MSSFAKTMFIENPGTPLTSANPEFQAVILSGYGSRMYPLTEESNLPKALLPIANKVTTTVHLFLFLDFSL
jgi:hypothetical protein